MQGLLSGLVPRLIPARLHRAIYRLGHRLRRMFLRHLSGEVHGCTVLGWDESGNLLLVRHSYGPPVWALPGGGMRRNEDAEAAAQRELHEELGCMLLQPVFVGQHREDFLGSTNHVAIFSGRVDGRPCPDMREVVEARFFAPDALPANLSTTVRKRLRALKEMPGS